MTAARSSKSRRGPASLGALDPIETASRDEIAALQLQRLRWTLTHSYANVPHFRAKCEAAGVHPADCRSLDDLARFPFTVKADLRETFPYGLLAVPREQLARLHASSGTTGQPTVVGYTKGDLDHWADLVARSIRAAGGRAGDLVHVAYGYGLFTGGLGAHYGAERLGCTVVPMSGGQTEKQVQFIRELGPDILMCTPSYALVIADECRKLGIDPADLSLSVGIHGAEPWTEGMRSEIEANFAIDALDIYGLSEVMGPGVASECIETKDGLVVWEDHFYPEIIDPETGAVLPDGSPGELVFTSLTKEAMPVVRYRTRDLSVLLPGTARSMRRLGRIGGRSDDMLIIRGVNVFPSQIEGLILEAGVYAPHYLLELRREGRLDTLTIIVEPRDASLSMESIAHAAHQLTHRVKTFVGVSVTVRHEQQGGIPRSAGKARRVVDLR
ncbi:MAG: phenylacetate--CoA ligase PaaK [Gemmatimonadales bacterium]